MGLRVWNGMKYSISLSLVAATKRRRKKELKSEMKKDEKETISNQ